MAKNKVAQLTLAVLLLAMPLFGQYSATYSQQGIDVLNSTLSPYAYNCVSDNCWVNFTGAAESISAAPDGTIYVVNSSHKVYQWDFSTTSWAEETNMELSSTYGYTKYVYSAGAGGGFVILSGAGSNNVWYLNGSGVLTRWAGSGYCSQAGTDYAGDVYCIGNSYTGGNVYEWPSGGSAWAEVDGTLSNIAVSPDGLVFGVNSSNHLFGYNGSWTDETSNISFVPSSGVGAITVGDDEDAMLLDTSSNTWVTHDGGETWAEADSGGFTPSYLASGNRGMQFAVGTNGDLYHLNAILPQTSYTITGSCGSACSGDPDVTLNFYSIGGVVAGLSCAPDWETNDDPECYLSSTADVDQNATNSYVVNNCDAFAPGTPGSPSTCTSFQFKIDVLVSGLAVFTATQDCDCKTVERPANQKYYVSSSNYSSKPTDGIVGFIGSLFGTYTWDSTALEQWCTNSPLNPFLPNEPVNLIIYKSVSSKPTAMPGRYVNGDVESMFNVDTAEWFGPLLAELTVYASGGVGGSSHIYTWNNSDTQQRGTGGEPTTPCQGSTP